MPFPYELDSNQPQEEPLLVLIEGQELHLSPSNTIIRQFRVGNGQFDYALHAPDEVSYMPIFFDQPGGRALLARLKIDEYPLDVADRLDQETIDLIERRIRDEIDGWIQIEYPGYNSD